MGVKKPFPPKILAVTAFGARDEYKRAIATYDSAPAALQKALGTSLRNVGTGENRKNKMSTVSLKTSLIIWFFNDVILIFVQRLP